VVFVATGCHDTGPSSAAQSLAPSDAPSRAKGLLAADPDWNTFSAVVTIHEEGAQFTGGRIDDASFRVTRVLQTDSTWLMTVAPRGSGASGRIEIGKDGIRSYDAAGKEMVHRGPDLAKLAAAARAGGPVQASLHLPAQSPGSGAPPGRARGGARDWADAFLAEPATGPRAQARLVAMFGAPDRVDARLRYRRASAGKMLELLVDSLTGAPLEVKEFRGGVLAVHAIHEYERLANGSALLREIRVERPSPNGTPAAITITRFDSVTFGRGGPVQ
jgi:hypothetical protein